MIVDGRVLRVLRTKSAVTRAVRSGARHVPLEETGDVLLPGLVNAHAHLDLSGLRGKTPRAGRFGDWIGAVLKERAKRGPRQFDEDLVRGAERALATGTTTVGDIDSTGAGPRVLGRHGLRIVQYREVLDARDPTRTAEAIRASLRRWPRRKRRVEGLSPHAPFTVSDELLRACGARAKRERLPLAVHWAETQDENDYLLRARGPLAGVLGPSPRRRGLACLEQAGLLGPRTALVHANHVGTREPDTVARSGAGIVHCPGSHRFFEREPFRWERWLGRGVPVALGTDSLASNEDLDLVREMALARSAEPALAPEVALSAATEGGARALGLEGEIGQLGPGAWADAVLFRAAGDRAELAEAVTMHAGSVAGVWLAGRRVTLSSRGRRGWK